MIEWMRFRLFPAVAAFASLATTTLASHYPLMTNQVAMLQAPLTSQTPLATTLLPFPLPPPEPAPVPRELLELREQNKAILAALNSMKANTDQRFHEYAFNMQSRLDLLERSLTWQRASELEDLATTNRYFLHLALGVVGFFVLTILLLVLLPMRQFNRAMARAMAASTSSRSRAALTGTLRWHALVERLERRIHELETGKAKAALADAPEPKTKLIAQPEVAPATQPKPKPKPSPALTNPPRKTPHLGLALAHGESLMLLPDEDMASSCKARGELLQRVKKWFHLGRLT